MKRALRRLLVLGALLISSACALPTWPANAPLTSGYGVRFFGARPDIHRGVDLDVPIGTPIVSMAGGTVRFAGWMRGFGNVVFIDHAGGLTSVYAHLSEIQVSEGQGVSTAQQIGLSGDTGQVTAPHLHFEVWRFGRPVDPIAVLGGPPG